MAEILEELSRAEEDFISQIMAFAQGTPGPSPHSIQHKGAEKEVQMPVT